MIINFVKRNKEKGNINPRTRVCEREKVRERERERSFTVKPSNHISQMITLEVSKYPTIKIAKLRDLFASYYALCHVCHKDFP